MSLIGISSLKNLVTSDNTTVNSSMIVITVHVINEVSEPFLQNR